MIKYVHQKYHIGLTLGFLGILATHLYVSLVQPSLPLTLTQTLGASCGVDLGWGGGRGVWVVGLGHFHCQLACTRYTTWSICWIPATCNVFYIAKHLYVQEGSIMVNMMRSCGNFNTSSLQGKTLVSLLTASALNPCLAIFSIQVAVCQTYIATMVSDGVNRQRFYRTDLHSVLMHPYLADMCRKCYAAVLLIVAVAVTITITAASLLLLAP